MKFIVYCFIYPKRNYMLALHLHDKLIPNIHPEIIAPISHFCGSIPQSLIFRSDPARICCYQCVLPLWETTDYISMRLSFLPNHCFIND